MSKYDALWRYIEKTDISPLTLTFDEIAELSGTTVDHSFLHYKSELQKYGYAVDGISIKNKRIRFCKIENAADRHDNI